MKILVSGATGFVGSHLLPRLREAGHDVVTTERGKTDVAQLAELMRREKPAGIIHLASTFLKEHKPEDIRDLIDSNILLGTNLLEAASSAGAPWFINTGSYWQHYKDAEYSPVNLYAATKQAFEDIGRYYAEARGINFITLALFDNFGPGDTRPKIFSLWQRFTETGGTLEMSPGDQLMDITYIDNVIDGYLRAIELISSDSERKLSGETFALSGERMTLKELAAIFVETTGKPLTIAWGARPYRPREVMIPWHKGKVLPGWTPRIPLREGIRRTFLPWPEAGKKPSFP